MILDISSSPYCTMGGVALVQLVQELSVAASARAPEMAGNASSTSSFLQNLVSIAAVLFGLICAFGMLFIRRKGKAALERASEANEVNEIFLNAAPFVMCVWNDSCKLVSANKQSVEIFGLSDKEQYIESFFDLSPEYQPCGRKSQEKALGYIREAFSKGSPVKFEWMHQTVNGEPLPAEVTLVRFTRRGKNLVVGYTVDLRPVRRETERIVAEIRRREIAEEESQAKTRFLARMSHEIRTPMNAVLGIAGIQLQKEGLQPDTEEAFSRIHTAASLLLNIINDILDLSKVEAGMMEIVPATYEMTSLVVDTVQFNLMYIGSKQIDFKLSVDPRLPSYLIGDELRIKQVLNNLLSNAFKYTPEGTVTLSFGLEASSQPGNVILVIAVSDTGQGMNKEQIDHLFAGEFHRFNLVENRAIEGSGLGMPITHSLISMMQGDIQVKSEPGKGTLFTVRLPQKTYGSDVVGEDAVANLQSLETFRKPPKKFSRLRNELMPYGRVLAVDDVEVNLYVVEGILAAYEITVETAESGPEAIEKVKNGEVYDIIFMDHMMPGMDGVETTRIIRSMGYDHPIVALTANALKDSEEMFMNNGFSGFISKPIDISQMDAYITRFIRDKQPPEVIDAIRAKMRNEFLESIR